MQKGWVQPPAALVVSPWMDRSHILGRITPYAVQNQRNSATHELQESDDLARIRHMIEVQSSSIINVNLCCDPFTSIASTCRQRGLTGVLQSQFAGEIYSSRRLTVQSLSILWPSQALSGEHQVLNSAQKPITEFCMYSERNSGSNWVSSLIQVCCTCLLSRRISSMCMSLDYEALCMTLFDLLHITYCLLSMVMAFCNYTNYERIYFNSLLVQANFRLDYLPAKCPHKHDLGMSMPNEFTFLPADVLVVAVFRYSAANCVRTMHALSHTGFRSMLLLYEETASKLLGGCRNAFDWAASMHRHPWHAPNHCNTSSFGEFLLREWSPGSLAGDLLDILSSCRPQHDRCAMMYMMLQI